MLNHVFLMGRLVRDPELRYTPGGDAVCNFAVAINEGGKDPQGNKTEKTIFVDCSCWKRQAEAVAQYKHKGDLVLVEGKLSLNEWTDTKTHQKRSKLTITCFLVQFLDAGHKTQTQGGEASPDEELAERW